MISKRDIEKMVRHIAKRDRGIPDKRLMHPKREWGIIVMVSVLLCAGGIAWGYTQYVTYTQLTTNIDIGSVGIVDYNRTDVLEVIEVYETRARVYESLRASVPPPLPEPQATASTSAPDAVLTATNADDVIETESDGEAVVEQQSNQEVVDTIE